MISWSGSIEEEIIDDLRDWSIDRIATVLECEKQKKNSQILFFTILRINDLNKFLRDFTFLCHFCNILLYFFDILERFFKFWSWPEKLIDHDHGSLWSIKMSIIWGLIEIDCMWSITWSTSLIYIWWILL